MTPIIVAVLAFERLQWRRLGAKEQAAHDLFGLTPTRYFQIRGAVIDNPAAFELDPQTVARLRRLREQGRRARAS